MYNVNQCVPDFCSPVTTLIPSAYFLYSCCARFTYQHLQYQTYLNNTYMHCTLLERGLGELSTEQPWWVIVVQKSAISVWQYICDVCNSKHGAVDISTSHSKSL